MESEFSEGQFELGLAAEMAGKPPGSGLFDRIFRPTQYQESQLFIDLGVRMKIIEGVKSGDVQLVPLFIQTKKSEKLTQSWTEEWQKLDNIIGIDNEYFRFNVYLGKHEQHNQLVSIGQNWPLTFYAAPAFIEYAKYWEYRANEQLFWNTAFIQTGGLKSIEEDGHIIAFNFPDPKGCVLSEPQEIDVRQGDGLFREDELISSSYSFNLLAREFSELRRTLFYEFGIGRTNEDYIERIGSPDDYDSEDVLEWTILQKQFFRMSVDVNLDFIPINNGNIYNWL